jgi:hypothetical protein
MSTDLDTEFRHVEAAGSRSQRAAEGSRYPFAAVAVCSIWLALAAASIWSPELVSGTDRTHVPIGALVSPIAGVLATAFASVFVAGSAGGEVKE